MHFGEECVIFINKKKDSEIERQKKKKDSFGGEILNFAFKDDDKKIRKKDIYRYNKTS